MPPKNNDNQKKEAEAQEKERQGVEINLDTEAGDIEDLRERDVRMHPELNQQGAAKQQQETPAALSPEEREQLAPGEQPTINLDDADDIPLQQLGDTMDANDADGNTLPDKPYKQSSAPAGDATDSQQPAQQPTRQQPQQKPSEGKAPENVVFPEPPASAEPAEPAPTQSRPYAGEQNAPGQSGAPEISRAEPTPEQPVVPNPPAREEHDEQLSSPTSPHPPDPEQAKEQISADVERILKEAKLPERRQEFRASGDAQPDAQKEESPLQQALAREVAEKEYDGDAHSAESGAVLDADAREQEERASIIPSMRTIKDDLQGLVQSSKMSMVRAASLEQAKRRGVITPEEALQDETQEQKSNPVRARKRRRIIGITLAVVALVVLGGAALMVVSVVMNERQGTDQTQSVTSESLIFTEQTFTLSITNESSRTLLQQLANARNAVSLTLGAITRVVPVIEETNPETGAVRERAATTQEFLGALNTEVPDTVLRFIGEEFFLGIHTIDQNTPLLIVPVTSYERVFAGMLEWEEDMNTDLAPFFTQVPRERETADGDIVPVTFEDVIIRNFDVRVLRDAAGEIRMLYAFPTREILIIAESPHSFVEALARLRAERKL